MKQSRYREIHDLIYMESKNVGLTEAETGVLSPRGWELERRKGWGKVGSLGIELHLGASIYGVLLQDTMLWITIMGSLGCNPGGRVLAELHGALGFDL